MPFLRSMLSLHGNMRVFALQQHLSNDSMLVRSSEIKFRRKSFRIECEDNL